MKWRIAIAAASIGAALQTLGSVAVSPPAHADDFDEGLNCAVLNGISCADAFRHCAWIGALATRLGEQDAYRVGFVHEEYDAEQPKAEMKMDDWNNFTGAAIGSAAVSSGTSDQWGYVLNECESRARSYQLYGLGGVKGNYST